MSHSTQYQNELIKRKFFTYLKNSKGFSDNSIQSFESALWLWEEFFQHPELTSFNQTKAVDFKDWLKAKKKRQSTQAVSLSYCYDNLRYLRTFFEWLSHQLFCKGKINFTDIEYLNLTKKESRAIRAPHAKKFPTLENIQSVIENILPITEVDRRDKALLSLTFLTGARITALASLPVQSFDSEDLTIDQNPKLGVKTKFSKRIVTALIPFSYKEPLQYFIDWVTYLKEVKKFQPTDPLFPATKRENGQEALGYYSTGKVEPIFWKSSSSPRKIFEKRFQSANVPYFHPHTFRHLLVKEISKIPLTEEEKKAISQNLGHDNVGTTFGSYGYGGISEQRQVEIVKNISFDGKAREVKYMLSKEEIKELVKTAVEEKSTNI